MACFCQVLRVRDRDDEADDIPVIYPSDVVHTAYSVARKRSYPNRGALCELSVQILGHNAKVEVVKILQRTGTRCVTQQDPFNAAQASGANLR